LATLVGASNETSQYFARVARYLFKDEKHRNNVERLFSYICALDELSSRLRHLDGGHGGGGEYLQPAISSPSGPPAKKKTSTMSRESAVKPRSLDKTLEPTHCDPVFIRPKPSANYLQDRRCEQPPQARNRSLMAQTARLRDQPSPRP
jgi:hypothetical protein